MTEKDIQSEGITSGSILDQAPSDSKRSLVIDYLFLDLNQCERCMDTEGILDETAAIINPILEATGFEVTVNKIHIENEALADQHKFLSSPTIRVNGQDIQLEYRENSCQSCGDICGDDVDCRVWVYQGKEYETPPKAMLIEAILGHIFSRDNQAHPSPEDYKIPDNLTRFFTAKSLKDSGLKSIQLINLGGPGPAGGC